MKAAPALVALFGLLISTVSHAETLLCVEDVAGGIKFVDGAWKGVTFKVGRQFAVTSTDKKSYEVKEIGQKYAIHSCTRETLTTGELANQMACGGMGYGMLINFEKLRYIELYTWGYIEDDQTGKNTPSVTGGKCSLIMP
ncbi:hypothetical protein J2W42_002242 [Rhizobium tibeticum]|uniref:hypothetical protein n=1 Tax=Rhizobium tibeticum TaxID=501024 RepID=UPI00277F51D3|nr:hypothetical protein [Rhizobium tibeticum]MDP9809394.1 hypothetical protein [Rhizobium tibeticum]